MRYARELVVMVGNIGSGKSTYVKDMYACDGYAVVSRDALRYMFGGGEYLFDKTIEPTVAKTTIYAVEKLMRTNVNIVIDETNMNIRMREDYLFLAKKYGYTATAIIMPRFTKEEAVKRRLQDPHGNYSKETWEEIWDRFDNMYERPTMDEGFDKVEQIKETVFRPNKEEKCIGCGVPLTEKEIERDYDLCSACVDDMNRALEGEEAHPIAKEEDKEEIDFEHMDEYELAEWAKTLPIDYPFLYIPWK